MSDFPSLITNPPALTAGAQHYLDAHNGLSRMDPKDPSWHTTFENIGKLGEKLTPDDRLGLRANAANKTMHSLQQMLATGQATDLNGGTHPMTAAERKNAESSLAELKQGRMPTKGGSVDVSTGEMQHHVPQLDPKTTHAIRDIGR